MFSLHLKTSLTSSIQETSILYLIMQMIISTQKVQSKRANILARALRQTTNKGESHCVRERIGKIDTLQCNKWTLSFCIYSAAYHKSYINGLQGHWFSAIYQQLLFIIMDIQYDQKRRVDPRWEKPDILFLEPLDLHIINHI